MLSATTLDANGSVLTGRAVTWSTSDAGLATVNASGMVTAAIVRDGNPRGVVITATSEGRAGSTSLTVQPEPAAHVVLAPDSARLLVGTVVQFSATVLGADGAPLTGRTIQWSTTDLAVATVSIAGLLTAVQHSGAHVRSVRVIASSEGVADSALVTVTPLPEPTLEIDLPIAPGDASSLAYGIWPFGVHGASHALDGHPGMDIEYRVGASVRAAAAGIVQSIIEDDVARGLYVIRLAHDVGPLSFATDYTNIGPLAAGITRGASVSRGQPLGVAGSLTLTIGQTTLTFAMTHFQFNDFRVNDGLTNQNAVSPESALSASGRAMFEALWAASAYTQELTEPFATNPRTVSFPMTRTWTTTTDPAVARIDVIRASPTSTAQTYEIRSTAGALLESGVVTTVPRADASTVDFTPGAGPARLGVFDIVGGTMRLMLGAPGAPRPGSLAGARVYITP